MEASKSLVNKSEPKNEEGMFMVESLFKIWKIEKVRMGWIGMEKNWDLFYVSPSFIMDENKTELSLGAMIEKLDESYFKLTIYISIKKSHDYIPFNKELVFELRDKDGIVCEETTISNADKYEYINFNKKIPKKTNKVCKFSCNISKKYDTILVAFY